MYTLSEAGRNWNVSGKEGEREGGGPALEGRTLAAPKAGRRRLFQRRRPGLKQDTRSNRDRGPLVTRLWRVSGRVQGVGFRAFVRRRAQVLGIRGYARNMPDGTVEVLATGHEAAVAELFGELQRGPRYARVQSVTEVRPPRTDVPGDDTGPWGGAGFVIR